MWDTGMDWGRQRGTDRNAACQRPVAWHSPAAWRRAVLLLRKGFIRRISTNPNRITEILRWKWKFKLLECLSSFVYIWLLTRWTHTQYHPQLSYEWIYERWSNMSWNCRTASWELWVLPAELQEAFLGAMEAPSTPLLRLSTPLFVLMQQSVGPHCKPDLQTGVGACSRKNIFGGLSTLHHEILGSRPAAEKLHKWYMKYQSNKSL